MALRPWRGHIPPTLLIVVLIIGSVSGVTERLPEGALRAGDPELQALGESFAYLLNAAPAFAVAPAPAPSVGPSPGPAPGYAIAGERPALGQQKVKEIKEVKHYKHPGGLYKKGSPLYEKQQKMRAMLAQTKVSTTMKCIIFMTAQFFIVYTMLFITQTVNKVKGQKTHLERCLQGVAKTLYFIPMLCVLFLATRMRAVQLSQGLTDHYELPQWWVKQAMLACSLAVCLQTALAAIYYALLKKDPDGVKGGSPTPTQKALNYARWFLIACLCFGFMIVCIGVCTMQAPTELWGKAGGPKVSPAVWCTIFLCTLYFAVHFCIELVKTLDECLTPEGKRFGVLAPQTLFLRECANTVDISPMLCILFLAARLRALQLDPKAGSPPPWAQTFFYVSSFSVLGSLILSLVSALLLKKEGLFTVNQEESGSSSQRPSAKVKAVEGLRAVFMFFLYLGAAVVIISMFMQKSEDGPTPVIPPSVKCTMIMTTVYFVVYAALWITTTMKKLRMPAAAKEFITNMSNYLEKGAKEAIDFSPMLCVMFLGTFMRALQITGGKGAPQRWAQTFMYVGTMAVVLLTVSRLDYMLFPRNLPTSPEDPSAAPKPMSPKVSIFFNVLQHLCLVLLYMSVVVVIVALVTMTPETAKGTGAIINLGASSDIM